MTEEEYVELFYDMTVEDETGIRRWRISKDVCDPYDFELAKLPVSDRQTDAFYHWQLDRFDAGVDF